MPDDARSTESPCGQTSLLPQRHASLIDRCRVLPIGSVARIDGRLAVERVAGLDLPEQLFGWRAPTSWHGIAIVLGGHADSAQADEAGVTLGALALSDGACVAWADLADHCLTESDAPIGLVPDTCRRVMGLRSHPGHPRVTELANLRWLSEILHVAADPTAARAVTDWDGISALHPAVDRRPLEDADGLALSLIELEQLTSWSQVHQLGSRVGWEDLTAAEVEWMDPEMFARWTVGSHRPMSELVADLSLFLPSHLLGAVCAVLLGSTAPA